MARPPRAHPPAGLPPLLRLPRRRCTARPPDRLVGSPSQALIPVPPATRLCYSAWAPSTQAGPGGPGRFQAPGLLSLHPDPGLQAAPRPLPVRVPQALAAPVASVALPACPSFAPQSIDPLRASLHPLSGPSSPLRPIRAASGAPSPARQSVAHSVWYPRPWPSVSSLQPRAVRKASAPRAFRPLPQPHPFTLQSAGCPGPAAWPPQSRPPRSVRQTAEAARRQSGYVALGLASWP